jgi:hypothetical protein
VASHENSGRLLCRGVAWGATPGPALWVRADALVGSAQSRPNRHGEHVYATHPAGEGRRTWGDVGVSDMGGERKAGQK